MAKFCSNCGKELNDNADICLNCGVLVNKKESKIISNNNVNNSKKKGLPTWAIVLIVLGCVILIPLIIIILVGIFAFNVLEESVIEEKDGYFDKIKDSIYDYTENYEVIDEGTIGDSLEIDGVRFTLSEALKYDSIGDNTPVEGNEYLVFFFDVENTSSEEKLVTYLNFSGLVDDERIIPTFIFGDIDGTTNLNKNLEAGETTKGYVAFEVDKNWEDFDLSYRKLLGDKVITFYVTNEKNNNAEV